jgi:ABC-type Fe3+/spermidine/putrescine transport system ATPase subunit
VVRPEKLSLVSREHAACINGRVKECVYVGDFMRYRVEVGDALTLTVKVQNSRLNPRVQEGEVVGISFDPRDIRILDR